MPTDYRPGFKVFISKDGGENVIKDKKGKVIFSSMRADDILKHANILNLKIVQVEYGNNKKVNSLLKPIIKGTKRTLDVHNSVQYKEHHNKHRIEKPKIKRLALIYGIEYSQAELLFPLMESHGEALQSRDWDLAETKAEEFNSLLESFELE